MRILYFHLALVSLCFLFIGLQKSTAEDSSVHAQLFGSSWPIPFKKNAQTLPSIEVRLDPPEDPLPQVSAEIQLLERARIRMEEGLMAKLEDEYNKQLDKAQTGIDNAVDQAIRVFDDPRILTGAVRGAILPIKHKREAVKATEGSFAPESAYSANIATTPNMPTMPATLPLFRQRNKNKLEVLKTETSSVVNLHQNGPIDLTSLRLGSSLASSFMEIKSATKSGGRQAFGNIIPPPAVQIQVDDIKAPDSKIKTKMDEIEQKRADEETKMFEQAVTEFEQLTRITIQELKKNIQIQMNPFLVDTRMVVSKVEQELPKRGTISKLLAFREINDEGNRFIGNKCVEVKEKYPNFKLDCNLLSTGNEKPTVSSFLQVTETTKLNSRALLSTGMDQQLNVRVGQSDKPYPTIDELFSDTQKKRDATERLERMKVLQLQLKLLKAMNEMIKGKLRVALARVIAQFGPAIETIKTEIAAEKLS